MNKKIIIRTLEKIALYLELQGENPFKVSAFRKAAAALETDERSLSEIADITAIKGIGKGTAAVITDLIDTGESSVLKELEEVVPKGLVPLMKLPGLGGKKLAKLYQELNVVDADTLKEACETGKVQALAGFGSKTEEKILKELANFGARAERLPVWQLEPVVLEINELLASLPEIEKFSVAGSFRRVSETSKDVDFIIATDAHEVVREAILTRLAILETISTAITAAETGHLVFGTLHTSSAPTTIDRIIDVFPPHQQGQIRIQLANVLQGIISQRLFIRKDHVGRVAATEILVSVPAVTNLIRNEKIHQIPSVMQTNRALGMHTLETSIQALVTSGKVSLEEARPYMNVGDYS